VLDLGCALGLGRLSRPLLNGRLRRLLGLGGAKHRHRGLVGWAKRRDRYPGLGGRSPRDDATKATCEAVLRLQHAAVLLGERVGERRPRDEPSLHDDLTQPASRLRLFLECLRELLLAEEARSNQDPAELGCWKFRRIHDSSYRRETPDS
jgi:hypothetical protein